MWGCWTSVSFKRQFPDLRPVPGLIRASISPFDGVQARYYRAKIIGPNARSSLRVTTETTAETRMTFEVILASPGRERAHEMAGASFDSGASLISDVLRWPPCRRHRQHDETQRDHRQSHEFECKCVHGPFSPIRNN